VSPEVTIDAAGGRVSVWLPEGGQLAPDPADHDLLWWMAPGSNGGFSLAVSAETATRPDALLSMERELADRVEVERDELVPVGGQAVQELQFTTERHEARSWTASPSGRREMPGGVERRTVRRRFWPDAGVSAGYIVPDGEPDARAVYDRMLQSVRVAARG
jgi:hypothetical protein